MTFSNWLKLHGILVQDLAKKLGVTRAAVYALGKNGKPTMRTLTRVSAAISELGTPVTAVELYYECFADERERALIENGGRD